ncbi:MAG: hypothetical protein CMH45_06330 [Muricauda sp.]|nr:uroporphyrinogen-III synthase [Allomuricauda sp.]MAU27009.1 hypothetical protein [Allomuricauda sp.]|tara:strand:- start:32868 stop:33971 length:1104 start_codon:yes stop_codon:yes gene_type:complete
MNIKTKIARLLRQEQTEAEKKLWGYVRNRQFENLKFKRQHPLKEYIVDFFCEEYGIIIELDGDSHNQINQKEKDELRDKHLRGLGYYVLRFENQMVFKNIDVVFKAIQQAKTKQDSYAKERKKQLEDRKKARKGHLTPALSPRRGGSTVLSTKILSKPQKELLLAARLGLVEYNAIEIDHLDFELETGYDNYIFTSQNAVKSYTKKENSENRSKINAFCVGKKTASLLKHHGFSVIETADHATDLAQIIVEEYGDRAFLFLSGNQRRQELPTILEKNNVQYKEIVVYETHLAPKRFERHFEGILFFSPSGVQSFTALNSLEKATAFCIGDTTANEAKKHTDNVVVANKPTIENVLVQAVKHFSADTH